ncbi:Fc.00g099620.m01.CDS01 [Cosmosporella sp. VM-42]
MPIESRFSVSVPNCSIQQWVFGSPSGSLPDKKAWIDADRPQTHFLTYSEGRLLAKRIAAGLLENGLKSGDRVLLFSGNSIFFPAIVLGIWMAGGIFTGANPGYVARELAFQLKDSEACMMIAADPSFEVALEAAKQVGLRSDRVFLFDSTMPDSPNVEKEPRMGSRHWTELITSRDKGDQFKWTEPKDSKTTTCTLNYSSGTTGIPKGVEISHYNNVANGLGVVTFHRLHPEYEARTQRASALCFLPMYHAFSQGYFINYFPYERIPVYVMPSFDFPKMLSHIQTYRITKLFAVPPILVLMSKHPLARQADLSSIDMIASGAAPLAKDTQREIDGMMPQGVSMVRQGWGMTEVTCSALSWDPKRPSSSAVGELMPDCRARLVDIETDAEITQANSPGELWITGPSVMRGYWRNTAATNEAFVIDKDGTRWLRTGDIAFVEEFAPGTLFHIVDRVKELIKTKGYQVAPAELESLLLEREDVADAAVVGVVIDGEELPRAYVVKSHKGKNTTEEDVATWLAGRVARHKQLKGGVVFVDAIPKIPSGKILRKTLRERARREVGSGSSSGGEVRAKL